MKRSVTSAILTALVSSFLLIPSPKAYALSCVDPQTILKDHPLVFSGTIDSFEGDVLTVNVENIWVGERLPKQVDLTVVLNEWLTWTETGQYPKSTLVFAPNDDNTDGKLEVNPCTIFTEQQVAKWEPVMTKEPLDSTNVQVSKNESVDFQKESKKVAAVAIAVFLTFMAAMFVWDHSRH